MARFGKLSRARLDTCHKDLQRLFDEVVKHYDCSIVCGYRGEILQTKYYKNGSSKVAYPNSKHNTVPSIAVDAAPYIEGQICWDKEQLYFFAAFVWATAIQMGIKIRLGADWDGDGNIKDQRFIDRPHFELVGK